MSNEKSVPTGIKIISVLYYIGAAFGVIFGLLFFVGAGAIGIVANQIPLLSALGSGLFIVGGIVMIGLGVLSFFIGKDLRKTKPWARVVVIIFSALGALSAVASMIQGNISGNILNLAIQLGIGGYLLFNNNVKQAFA